MSRVRKRTKVEVSSWDEALNVINGKPYVLDGIHGHLKVDRSRQFYTRVMHEPSKRGRQTDAYLKLKREYHDDWDTDLSDSERLPDIVGEFVKYNPKD